MKKHATWARRPNAFKEALVSGQPAVAMWVTVPWPPLLELLGAVGLDAAFIDMEHASCSIETVQNMIVAAELGGVTPLVRPRSSDPTIITQLLDAGADGIVFPLISDAAAARRAVGSTRFAPRGVRGWGGPHTRRAMWQGTPAVDALRQGSPDAKGVSTSDYVDRAESDVLVILLIESVAGVENIDQIACVEGVDAVIFGWGDYSVEVGFDLERCEEAAWRVYNACRENSVGVSISLGQSGPTQFYSGCFYVSGVDALIISAALQVNVGTTKNLDRINAQLPAETMTLRQDG